MTEAGRVAKLEELLARVKARSSDPRATADMAHAGGAAHVEPAAARAPTHSEPELQIVEDSGELEVSSELIEVDVDMDEDNTLHSARALELEVVDDAEPLRTPAANEVVEEAPTSTPRPISDEYNDPFPIPRHTPPPESGKQVASAAPPAGRSSLPPESHDGHTLIGGWQKPGVPNFALPGMANVRVPAPVVPSPVGTLAPKDAPTPEAAPRPQPFRPEASTQPSASQVSPQMFVPPVRIAPEVTKPEPAPAAVKVASFEGQGAAFRPQSFGELLDASLAL